MRKTSLLTLTLVALACTVASARPSPRVPAQTRVEVNWTSALPVPEGAVIKLEVFNGSSSAVLVTDLWRAVDETTRSVDMPLPDREELGALLSKANNCQLVTPSRARVAFLRLGVWVGSARLGELQLFDGAARVMLGFADVDSRGEFHRCKVGGAPVLGAGWNVLRTRGDGQNGAAHPVQSPLEARYVSALPARYRLSNADAVRAASGPVATTGH